MSYRKAGPHSDNTSVDDDPLTDEDSENMKLKINEQGRTIRDYESTVADLHRQIFYLKSSHGKECSEKIDKLSEENKKLNEDLEQCNTNYNQVLASFAENKFEADGRISKQAETIKQLQFKIDQKDKEIEKLNQFIQCGGYCQSNGAFLQKNMM
uniref:Uncharacterized protein n=1 Tax=Meloidogyne hapla TaxID=6305 RepID=A0A1I8BME5_MELHA